MQLNFYSVDIRQPKTECNVFSDKMSVSGCRILRVVHAYCLVCHSMKMLMNIPYDECCIFKICVLSSISG